MRPPSSVVVVLVALGAGLGMSCEDDGGDAASPDGGPPSLDSGGATPDGAAANDASDDVAHASDAGETSDGASGGLHCTPPNVFPPTTTRLSSCDQVVAPPAGFPSDKAYLRMRQFDLPTAFAAGSMSAMSFGWQGVQAGMTFELWGATGACTGLTERLATTPASTGLHCFSFTPTQTVSSVVLVMYADAPAGYTLSVVGACSAGSCPN